MFLTNYLPPPYHCRAYSLLSCYFCLLPISDGYKGNCRPGAARLTSSRDAADSWSCLQRPTRNWRIVRVYLETSLVLSRPLLPSPAAAVLTFPPRAAGRPAAQTFSKHLTDHPLKCQKFRKFLDLGRWGIHNSSEGPHKNGPQNSRDDKRIS